MRSAPLTTIKGGISRLRTKGGARADTLYDLLNGYVTEAGTVVVRPGTRRMANLDPLTRGLCAFGSVLYTFCHTAVAVPYGYRLGILAHPPVTPSEDLTEPTTGDIARSGAVTITAGRYIGPGGAFGVTQTGYNPVVDSPAAYGGIVDATLEPDLAVHRVIAYGENPTPNTHFLLEIALTNPVDPGTLPPANVLTSVTFTGADAAPRTFLAEESGFADGYEGAGFRFWTWIVPSQFLFANAGTYEITVNYTVAGDPPPGPIALSKIHFAEPYMGGLYVVAEFENGNVYHYWLQPGETWEPSTAYKAGDLIEPAIPTGFAYRAARYGDPYPAWAPNVPRSAGDGDYGYEDQSVVEPTVYNDFYYECIETTGTNPTSAATEPVWPTDEGATVVERTDGEPSIAPTATEPPSTSVPSTTTKKRYGLFGRTIRGVVRP